MEKVSIIGLDLAKRRLQAHGAHADGGVAFRKTFSRHRVLAFLAERPRCVVAMEACGSAHHWGRAIGALGHEVRLIAPVYVKPFVRRQKNDAADAEAISEAAVRPTMRFAAVKTEEQQARGCRRSARIRARFFRNIPSLRTRSGYRSASGPLIWSTGRQSATRQPIRWTSQSASAPISSKLAFSRSSATARRKAIPPGSSSLTPTSPIRSAPRRSPRRNGRARSPTRTALAATSTRRSRHTFRSSTNQIEPMVRSPAPISSSTSNATVTPAPRARACSIPTHIRNSQKRRHSRGDRTLSRQQIGLQTIRPL